jgi:(p)ppGpp synthase/HD superfamily hydrolase
MKKFTNKDVQKSLDMAMDAHRGQVRANSKIPYVMHSIQVGNLVHHTGELKEQELLKAVIVANLHDVIANTKLTYTDIKSEFNCEISDAIEALSEKISDNNEDLNIKIDKFYKICEKISNQPDWVKLVKTTDVISDIIKLSDIWTLKEVEKYLFQLSRVIDNWNLSETLKTTFKEKKEEVIQRYK